MLEILWYIINSVCLYKSYNTIQWGFVLFFHVILIGKKIVFFFKEFLLTYYAVSAFLLKINVLNNILYFRNICFLLFFHYIISVL